MRKYRLKILCELAYTLSGNHKEPLFFQGLAQCLTQGRQYVFNKCIKNYIIIYNSHKI